MSRTNNQMNHPCYLSNLSRPTDSLFIKFSVRTLKVSYRRHICHFQVTNNIPHAFCTYVCDHSQNQCIVSMTTVTSDLNLSELRSFVPRPDILNKRENSYVGCWRCLRVTEFPWSESHAQPYCWNSKVNRLWGRWETRGWAEGEEHDDFEADWGAWTHWSWHQGAWGHWSSEQQQLDEKLWGCLLAMRKFWRRTRGLCLARLQCLISSSHLQWLFYRYLHSWTVVMIQMIANSSRSPFSFNCHLFARFNIFEIFSFMDMLFFFGQNQLSGTILPILTLRLWENLSRIASSRITTPVSEPLAT